MNEPAEPHDDSEWTEAELRNLLARSAKENGWDEAGMDAYDRYDSESFWQMIEKRHQEKGIPWEEAKKQLELDE